MGIIIKHISPNCCWAAWEINETLDNLKEQMVNLNYDLSEIDSFHSEERKKQWLAVRLLSDKLAHGKQIQYNTSGKPFLDNMALSISHSHQYVAVAINNEGDVGIDLQILDSKVMRIQRKFANFEEIEAIGQSLHLTTLVWSVKEAMYKLYGDGSPYFEKDYHVRLLSLNNAACQMMYNGRLIEKSIELQHFKSFVVAVVKD